MGSAAGMVSIPGAFLWCTRLTGGLCAPTWSLELVLLGEVVDVLGGDAVAEGDDFTSSIVFCLLLLIADYRRVGGRVCSRWSARAAPAEERKRMEPGENQAPLPNSAFQA